MRYTTIADLRRARVEYDRTLEECPHWDFESDGDPAAHACCAKVADAAYALKLTRATYRRNPMNRPV